MCIPVDRDIVWNMINDFNEQTIALSSYNPRTRKFPIHCHNALGVAQPCHILQLNLFADKEKGNSTRRLLCFFTRNFKAKL